MVTGETVIVADLSHFDHILIELMMIAVCCDAGTIGLIFWAAHGCADSLSRARHALTFAALSVVGASLRCLDLRVHGAGRARRRYGDPVPRHARRRP